LVYPLHLYPLLDGLNQRWEVKEEGCNVSSDHAAVILPDPILDSIDPLSPPHVDLVHPEANKDGQDVPMDIRTWNREKIKNKTISMTERKTKLKEWEW